jgi:hypothetical protein
VIAIVAHRAQHPGFVIPAETDDMCATRVAEGENGVNTSF